MIEQIITSFVKEIGFPIAAFFLMVSLYTKQSSNQRVHEERYFELTNNFIETLKKIQTEHSDTLNSITEKINDQNKALKSFFEHICEEQDQIKQLIYKKQR